MAPSSERLVAVDAARAAGDVLRGGFHAAHRVAFKGQTINLVTEMDVRAEELIVGRLASAFPDDTILAEERGASAGRSGRRWIVGSGCRQPSMTIQSPSSHAFTMCST